MFQTKAQKKKLSREIPLGTDRDAVGFAYLILPSDIDRVEYIQGVNKTGFGMFITNHNDVLSEVAIPSHILRELVFPEEAGVYGDCFSYITQPKTNQVVITGKMMKPGQSYASKENVHTAGYEVLKGSISATQNMIDLLNIGLVNNGEGEEGGHLIKSQGASSTSSISILCDGTVSVEADNHINVESGSTLTIEVGTEDDINTLNIDSNGVLTYIDRFDNELRLEDGKLTIESEEILHGAGASEFIALGNSLQTELDKSKARINGIIDALNNGVPIPQDGGTGYQASMALLLAPLISEDYSQILSEKNKVE